MSTGILQKGYSYREIAKMMGRSVSKVLHFVSAADLWKKELEKY